MAAFRSAARAVGVQPECFRERTGVGKLKDVAKCLGRDIATVSSLVSRYSEHMAKPEELKKQVARLTKHCLE
jgi:hypothetical protein